MQRFGVFGVVLAVALWGCGTTLPPKPFSHEVSPTEPLARITEIQDVPVWVRFLNSRRDRPVRGVGIALRAGETVRTEGKSLAQITLKDGLVVRLGKDGVAVLQTDGTVQITRGQVLAWVAPEPGKMATLETSFGRVTAEHATVYLELPQGERGDRLVQVLQGTAVVKLARSPEPFTVKSGELLRVKADGTAEPPKVGDPAAIAKQFDNHPLLFAFRTQIASLPQITSQFGLRTVVTTRTIEYQPRPVAPPPSRPAAAIQEPAPKPDPSRAAAPTANPEPAPAASPKPTAPPEPVATPIEPLEPVPTPEDGRALPVQPEPQPVIELVPPPERPNPPANTSNDRG